MVGDGFARAGERRLGVADERVQAAMDEMIPGFLGGRIEDYRLMAEDATLLLTEILSNRVKIEEQPVVEEEVGFHLFLLPCGGGCACCSGSFLFLALGPLRLLLGGA